DGGLHQRGDRGPAGLVVGQGGAKVAADPQDLGAGDPCMSLDRHADSLALAEQVDALCDRFEEALRAGAAGGWWGWLPPGAAARGWRTGRGWPWSPAGAPASRSGSRPTSPVAPS